VDGSGRGLTMVSAEKHSGRHGGRPFARRYAGQAASPTRRQMQSDRSASAAGGGGHGRQLFGLRQSSGALRWETASAKRQRTAALQGASRVPARSGGQPGEARHAMGLRRSCYARDGTHPALTARRGHTFHTCTFHTCSWERGAQRTCVGAGAGARSRRCAPAGAIRARPFWRDCCAVCRWHPSRRRPRGYRKAGWKARCTHCECFRWT